jgi:arylsulfatase A-like enzyme
VQLARGFRPQPLLPVVQRWQREAGLDPTRCVEVFSGVHVEHVLRRSHWTPGPRGTWTTPLPGGAFAHGAPGFLRIEAGERVLSLGGPAAELGPTTFALENGRIVMRLEPGEEPPVEMVLGQRMESGRLASDGVWQVRLGNEFDAGISVWSGLAEELRCDVPEASRLSFVARYATRSAPGEVALRVRLDGELVYECREDSAALAAQGRWLTCVLPPAARRRARLAFEASGPPGQALFLRPTLGPAELGTYGARPWPGARADIVLFLADTFRADNLTSGGGAGDLAPALEGFAERALRFRNARACAAWTLPSIGTLLSGLAPGQHTANEGDRALPAELTTVVEALSRAGYRTGAVTDAAFFTPIHGLEQGFETFQQNPPAEWDLDWTVRKALEFLEHDDGRPVFLLVHTYRTHLPYRVGPEEDRGAWEELKRAGFALLETKGKLPRADWVELLRASCARYRALYHEGVRDLDRGFGLFLEGLERSGLLETGYVFFTSDHGEALGENDDVFHGGELWESKLRVPLLVRAPGRAPLDVDGGVTLLDLAPTWAEIAGIPADPLWSGRSLFAPGEERPAFAFRLQSVTQVTLVEGARKLSTARPETLERGLFGAAYDLAADPHEEHPLEGAAWAAALARAHAALARELLTPAAEPSDALMSQSHRHELDGLGYGGGEE